MADPVTPAALPFPPMEAELVAPLPEGDGWQYEPKWDGFRGVLENLDGELRLWSRNGRPLLRYFPELRALGDLLPPGSALDGEVIVEREGALRFDELQMRLHPAQSRIDRLAREIPATYVAFDVLLLGGEPVHERPLLERRALLETLPFRVSVATDDVAVAQGWLERLEVAGFDGVIAKRMGAAYAPGSREAVVKVKHHRSADCVVIGVRWSSPGVPATLLLGLYDRDGTLRHVGSAAASAAKWRAQIEETIVPLLDEKPADYGVGQPSRWQTEGLEWTPARPEAVVEVRFDKWERRRFRHGTRLLRFRPDKDPAQCTFAQCEPVPGPGDPTVDSLTRGGAAGEGGAG